MEPMAPQFVISLGYLEFTVVGIVAVLLTLIWTGKFNGVTWTWKEGITINSPESEQFYNYKLEAQIEQIDCDTKEVILIDTLRLKPRFPAETERSVQLQATSLMRQLLAISVFKNHLTRELANIQDKVYFNNKVAQMQSVLTDYGIEGHTIEDICELFVLDWLKIVRIHLYPACEHKIKKYDEYRQYFISSRFKRLVEDCVAKNKQYLELFNPSFPLTIDMLDSSEITPLSDIQKPDLDKPDAESH